MSIASFIKNLQNSDDSRKVRWLIGLTIATMAIIVGLWILITPAGQLLPNGNVGKEDQPTLFSKIAISTKNVIETLRIKTANTINYFSHKISKTNTVEIQIEDTTPKATTDETNSVTTQ